VSGTLPDGYCRCADYRGCPRQRDCLRAKHPGPKTDNAAYADFHAAAQEYRIWKCDFYLEAGSE